MYRHPLQIPVRPSDIGLVPPSIAILTTTAPSDLDIPITLRKDTYSTTHSLFHFVAYDNLHLMY